MLTNETGDSRALTTAEDLVNEGRLFDLDIEFSVPDQNERMDAEKEISTDGDFPKRQPSAIPSMQKRRNS